MDLDTLDTRTAAETGVPMALRHPATDEVLTQTDGETPITLTLLGQDSRGYRAAMAAATDRRLARQAERGRVAMTSEGLEADGLTAIVACVVGWSGVRWEGQEQTCNPENVRAMFTRWAWAREQAEIFVGQRRNFIPNAAAA